MWPGEMPAEVFEYPEEDLLQLDARVLGEDGGGFVLFVTGRLEDERLPFRLEVEIGARFSTAEEGEGLTAEGVKPTLVWLCYPYLRELIASITTRAPVPTYFLPTMSKLPGPECPPRRRREGAAGRGVRMTRLTVVRRQTALDEIAADSVFRDVVDATLARPRMVWLLLLVIREYATVSQLEHGRGDGLGLSSVLGRQRFDKREEAQAQRIARGLHKLYRKYNAGNLRGAFLEALTEQHIRPRYGGSGNTCCNNAVIRIENGQTHTTSTGVDVLGWDGNVGECHDCKADAGGFRAEWIGELERHVAPRGFAIGLVTADSQATAKRKLRRLQIKWRRAQLISEQDFARLPLQP